VSLPSNTTHISSSSYTVTYEGTSDNEVSSIKIIEPCKKPVGYKLGTFDHRFGISKEAFLSEIAKGVSVWEDASGKDLFFYEENGDLTINLIYDTRQANTDEINYLALEIENSRQTAESLKEFYTQEKDLYTEKETLLIPRATDAKERLDAYNKKVTTYNTSGGASHIEYDAMSQELILLKKEVALIEEEKEYLASLSTSINKTVTRYNEIIAYINSLIKKSNSLGGKKFTEGKFSTRNATIDIYQYSTMTKLRRVLTHELGHALSIDHIENKNSIMYSVNIGTTTSLSIEDLEALDKVCSKN
jgi:predicted Zn-dependent protease